MGPIWLTVDVAADDCPDAGRTAGEGAAAAADGMLEVVGVGVGVEWADEGVAAVLIAFGLLPCLPPLPL